MPLTMLDIASSRAAMARDDQSLGELFLENTKLHPYLAAAARPPVRDAMGKTYPFAARAAVPADLTAFVSPAPDVLTPLEIYVVTDGRPDLGDGLYHYDSAARMVELLPRPTVAALFPTDVPAPGATMTFIISGVPLRLTGSAGDRAYRTLLLHAGRLCQHVHQVAASNGWSARVIDRFFDDRVNALIGVDGVNELTLAIAIVG